MKLIVDFILFVGIVLSILPIVGILKLKDRKTPQYILIVFWALILNLLVYFYAMLHELSVLKSRGQAPPLRKQTSFYTVPISFPRSISTRDHAYFFYTSNQDIYWGCTELLVTTLRD